MSEKLLTVHEVAELTGITNRTLHYYDEIGLLKASVITDARYRLYTEADIGCLQEILFFREIGFALKEIKHLLNSPSYSRQEALKKHLQLLEAKRKRIEALIEIVNNQLADKKEYSFDAFSNSNILRMQSEFREEIIESWGETDSYKEFEKVFSQKAQKVQMVLWNEYLLKTQNLLEQLATYENESPDSPEVQRIVKEWKEYISEHFYDCNNKILYGLSELYVSDERFSDFINRFGNNNLALFLSNAIKVFCSEQRNGSSKI